VTMDPNPQAVPEQAGQAEQPEQPQATIVQPGADGVQAGPPQQEAITQPAKLLRIASMVRELLEETRQASIDEPGRVRLREIYQRSVGELRDVLSPDLEEELAELAPPMEAVPTEAEIRVAQAQLVGWLEGLFQGIQAALFAQQAAARAQFDELRRRGLPTGQPMQQEPGPPQRPGQYL
jgi:hypothetical protein